MLTMKSYLTNFFIIICLILLTPCSTLVAENLYYSDRGDRYEGIKTEKPVSGGYFKLLGIKIDDGCQVDPSSPELTLSFCLPSPDTINIKVLYPGKNYIMVPKKKEFSEGTFSWPTEPVVKPLKLDTTQFQILVRNSTEELYFPARLATPKSSLRPIKQYQFTFETPGSVDFNVSILREDNDERVLVRQFKLTTRSPGIVPIIWDGQDDSGKKVSSGTFILRLEGSLRLKNSIEPREEEVPFYACIEN